MWTAILSLFTGQLPGIVREIAQARVDLSKTQNERERILAEERVHSLESRRDFLISNSRWAMYLLAAVLAPYVFYLWWVVGWDKIACHWVDMCRDTDPLSPWLEATFGSILALLTLKKA